MAEFCSCLICARRSAEGLPRLPGISTMVAMHVTSDDLGAPARVSRIKQTPTSDAPRPKYTQRQMIDAIGDALGMMREELETQSEARAAALEARLAMLEARTSPDELASRIGAQTRQLMQRLTAERPRDGHRTH